MSKRARLFALGSVLGTLTLAAGTAAADVADPAADAVASEIAFGSNAASYGLGAALRTPAEPYGWGEFRDRDALGKRWSFGRHNSATAPFVTVPGKNPVGQGPNPQGFTAATPEPSAGLVFGAGLLVVGAVLRKRRPQ